jgi:hypothetical protein
LQPVGGMLRAHVGRSGCRNGTWSSSELADFLINRPKPRSRAMNPQKHNPRLLRCPRSSTAKSCCGDDSSAIRGAGRARAPGIPDQQRLRCLRRRHDALSLMISRVAEGHREGELDYVGVGSVADAFAERYEMVGPGLVASWAGSAWRHHCFEACRVLLRCPLALYGRCGVRRRVPPSPIAEPDPDHVMFALPGRSPALVIPFDGLRQTVHPVAWCPLS